MTPKEDTLWDNDWIIDEMLTLQQKEVLYLHLEAYGIPIYSRTRNYHDESTHPFVGWMAAECVICSFASSASREYHIGYPEIMEILTKKIKQQEET